MNTDQMARPSGDRDLMRTARALHLTDLDGRIVAMAPCRCDGDSILAGIEPEVLHRCHFAQVFDNAGNLLCRVPFGPGPHC